MNELPFLTRLWFAWICYFRVLFDGRYAAILQSAGPEARALEAAKSAKLEPESESEDAPAPPRPPAPPAKKVAAPVSAGGDRTDTTPALQLLALLQREGRLIDFLTEDVASFADADIGAAARVVHSGCRKVLQEHVKLEPVRREDEGARVTLETGFSPAEVKLTGNVEGHAPYTGTLRHRGWRAKEVSLPVPVAGHDARVVAQAEVEL